MNFDALLELFQQRIPAYPWAQLAVYLLVLVLIAVLAQWLFGQVISRVAHHMLAVWGKAPWSKALTRHRANRRFGYAVGFAVITIGIGEVPHMGRYAVVIERLAHAGLWISFFLMLSGILGAWQDVYANTREAQTRSILDSTVLDPEERHQPTVLVDVLLALDHLAGDEHLGIVSEHSSLLVVQRVVGDQLGVLLHVGPGREREAQELALGLALL